MCTRFYIDEEHTPEISSYLEAVESSPLTAAMTGSLGKVLKTSGEIRPTDMVTVIAPAPSGRKSAYPMVWGYHIGALSRPVVNARVESAGEKAAFSDGWRRHRCIIPASCYFEWKHIQTADGKRKLGDKYALRPKDSSTTWLAGLYRIEVLHGFSYPVFTILTRVPGAKAAEIHNRMPLILPGEAIDDWIRPDGNPETIAKAALTDMICRKMEP
jgi:putative SOS response-associated peptidase YedK